MSDFNLDNANEETGFEPVTVTYREKEYKVGASAYGLMMAPGLLKFDGKNERETGAALVEALPKLLELLAPELAEAMEDPTVPEQLLLIQVITEVLNRLGRFQLDADES
jgi:hypothetical protein